MANPHHVIIEIYVVLTIVNVMLGVVSEIYADGTEGDIRSPFSQLPLGSDFDVPDAANLTNTIITPVNGTGTELFFWDGIFQNFEAIYSSILEFVKFFTGGFIIDLLNNIGFPGDFLYIVTAPLAIYVSYMTFVMITNRLGN